MENQNFVKIPLEVLENEKLSSTSKLMYGYIAGEIEKGNNQFLNKTIIDYFKISERTVSNCISELKENGFIKIEMVKNESGIIRHITLIVDEVEALKKQIKKMKCCGNCKFIKQTCNAESEYKSEIYACKKGGFSQGICTEWELTTNSFI